MLKNCLDNIENKSPLNILKKGYSLAYDSRGNILKSSENVKIGDDITVKLNEGSIKAKVTEAGE